MYLIDTRKYDDSFLLAKILEKVDFSDEEKKKLFKHFEKPEAVDAEPVVRCKDCKWFRFHKTAVWCEKEGGLNYPQDDSYCSYGEREEDEQLER